MNLVIELLLVLLTTLLIYRKFGGEDPFGAGPAGLPVRRTQEVFRRYQSGTDRPLVRNSRTASCRNSNEYGSILGINGHPLRPSALSRQVSTVAGELHPGV